MPADRAEPRSRKRSTPGGENTYATRTDQETDDDKNDSEDHGTADQCEDASNDKDNGDDPQDEIHECAPLGVSDDPAGRNELTISSVPKTGESHACGISWR